MIVVHGTRAFRDRIPGPQAGPGEASTTLLGGWYATVLRWRRPAALLVNEQTLLPLITPLAPAATLLSRLPDALVELLDAHRVPAPLIRAERMHASEQRLAPTANRSVIGVMTEFAFLADHHRADQTGLLDLSLRLAETPCSPLYERNTSPDRELAALIAAQPTKKNAEPAP